MRIGFIGSQGTGKTSMAQAFTETDYFKEKEYVFSPSSSRRLASRLGINQSASPFSQLAIMAARIGDEDRSSQGGSVNTVSDRTPLDSLAYTKYQFDHVWAEGDPEAEICLEVSTGLVARAMRDYDALLYFPVYGWPEENDGVRPMGEEYQAEIAFNCEQYIKEFDLPVLIVPNVSVDKRVALMVELLQRIEA